MLASKKVIKMSGCLKARPFQILPQARKKNKTFTILRWGLSVLLLFFTDNLSFRDHKYGNVNVPESVNRFALRELNLRCQGRIVVTRHIASCDTTSESCRPCRFAKRIYCADLLTPDTRWWSGMFCTMINGPL